MSKTENRPNARPRPQRGRPRGDDASGWSLKDLENRFGTPPSLVRSLIRAGHVRPGRRGRHFQLTFQDLCVMRTVGALHAAKITTRSITRALSRLRETLPPGTSLTAGSMGIVGDRLALREGRASWEPESGQFTLPLEPEATPAASPVSLHRFTHATGTMRAEVRFAAACELENEDPGAAIEQYRLVLTHDSSHAEARINLGRLLHLGGRREEAEAVYRAGEMTHPLLSFNLAVLLEDGARHAEAIRAYRCALASDPALSDAHFNLARLFQLAGDRRAALRHLLAYRRAHL